MGQITTTCRKCVLYFIAQVGLMGYYMFSLNSDPDTHNVESVSFLKWFFAVVLTIIAGEDEVGAPFNQEFWDHLCEQKIASLKRPVFGCLWQTERRYEFRCRMVLSFIVNRIFRGIILGTGPILLCVCGPMDFIKDCLAIFFITKLDDLDDHQDLQEVIEAFKIRESIELEIDNDLDMELA